MDHYIHNAEIPGRELKAYSKATRRTTVTSLICWWVTQSLHPGGFRCTTAALLLSTENNTMRQIEKEITAAIIRPRRLGNTTATNSPLPQDRYPGAWHRAPPRGSQSPGDKRVPPRQPDR